MQWRAPAGEWLIVVRGWGRGGPLRVRVVRVNNKRRRRLALALRARGEPDHRIATICGISRHQLPRLFASDPFSDVWRLIP